MNSDQLDKILDGARDDARAVLGELHPHILETAAAVLEATQDSGKARRKAKVKVNLTLTLHLNHYPPAWQVDGAVGVRRKVAGDKNTLEEETPELPNLTA